jgi:hypothetical protein
MNYRLIIISLLVNFTLTSCVDYRVEYIYIIENNISQPVKVSFETYPNIQVTDTVYALTVKEVYRDFSLCEKDFMPEKWELPFEEIDISILDSSEIMKDFKNADLWDFLNKVYEGTYVLVIDTSLLE